MPVVTFFPSRLSLAVEPGADVLQVARQLAVPIQSPCGGRGTCGRCLVRIQAGEVRSDSFGILSEAAIQMGYRLACRCRVGEESVELEVLQNGGELDGQFLDETHETCLVPPERFPSLEQIEPFSQRLVITVPSPRLADGLSDMDRLTRAVQQVLGSVEVRYSLSVLRQLATLLRQAGGVVTLFISRLGETPVYIHRIEAGEVLSPYYGIAVDIGTTTVAVQLVLLPGGQVVATQTAYNEQISCGLDVIGRIHYALRPGGLEELRQRVLATIQQLVSRLCRGNAVSQELIQCAVLAGNTTMVHLLLGLVPEYIRLEPYTPTVLSVPMLSAQEIGLPIFSEAPVYISPALGSYVGGDITAGLLCTGVAEEVEGVQVFLDIGTNGELVIGNSEFLLACACSAGPAFEGGGITCGMRAACGAIDSVTVDWQTGVPSFRTIGDVPPEGICGTGMISLIAQLFQTRWLDAAGKLDRSRPCPAITFEGRMARYIIASAGQAAEGKTISISETEIENIIRAKAAIYAACALMLEQVGKTFDDVSRVYIAGGFGRFLDIEKAITIGLIPDIPRQKYCYIGNSSLTGAYMMLVARAFREKQQQLAQRITYVELSTDPAYMDQFIGACFIPHTDAARFPSVPMRAFGTPAEE